MEDLLYVHSVMPSFEGNVTFACATTQAMHVES